MWPPELHCTCLLFLGHPQQLGGRPAKSSRADRTAQQQLVLAEELHIARCSRHNSARDNKYRVSVLSRATHNGRGPVLLCLSGPVQPTSKDLLKTLPPQLTYIFWPETRPPPLQTHPLQTHQCASASAHSCCCCLGPVPPIWLPLLRQTPSLVDSS